MRQSACPRRETTEGQKSLFPFFFVHPRDIVSAYCSRTQYVGVQLHGAYYLTLFAWTRIASLVHARNICHVALRVEGESDIVRFSTLSKNAQAVAPNETRKGDCKVAKKIKDEIWCIFFYNFDNIDESALYLKKNLKIFILILKFLCSIISSTNTSIIIKYLNIYKYLYHILFHKFYLLAIKHWIKNLTENFFGK